MNTKILKKIGLTDKEIDIFVFLLQNGASKATTIAKQLGTARTTVYRFLDSLLDKGLVSENIQQNVKIYHPVNPEKIPDILEERAIEIKEIIPELKNLSQKSREEVNVELFKGKEGIKTVMRDIIRENKPYTFIGEAEKYESEIELFALNWIKDITKKKIPGRLLCSEEQKFQVAQTEKYKLLPQELIPEISIWTYGEKTALFIWSSPMNAIKITSKSVTEGNKKSFEHFWSIAKSPSKKHLRKTLVKI